MPSVVSPLKAVGDEQSCDGAESRFGSTAVPSRGCSRAGDSRPNRKPDCLGDGRGFAVRSNAASEL